jgi:acyl-CoA reductase-like NAD-dependent aldehyde dehydrogenase
MMMTEARHFIDGDWVAAQRGGTFVTIDPSTEEPIATVARGTAEDVDRAVAAAARAMKGPWAALTPAERGRKLFALADRILAEREELALIETRDVGKPLALSRDSRDDVDGVAATLRYNAGAADKMEGTTIPLGPDFVDFTLLEPVGVTAHIVPWNYPLGMAIRSMAPALAAGCTAVLKPAEQSPLSALRLAELCRDVGFPPGVVNVVTGLGEEAGAALAQHPRVRSISFTGSVATGRLVMAAAATRLTPVVLELGGKNAMIVCADADLDRAVADAVIGGFENSGQVCSSSSRLLVERRAIEPFVERLVARASALTVGPGIESRDLGPLVSLEQFQRVTDYIGLAHKDGARLRCGGGRPRHLQRGYFVEPTVFDHVAPTAAIAREEIFGPVVSVIAFDTLDEAVAIANDSPYGLVAGVYTRDISRALASARQLETGSVWINGWYLGGVQAPTGGIKESGIGRERGLAGIRNYLQIKNIAIRL